MKFTLTLFLIMVFVLSVSLSATPLYNIWQDRNGDGLRDTWLGKVTAYNGGLSGWNNYNFAPSLDSGDPINGPNPEAYKSKMYLYDGSDGLSLGFIHNIDMGGNNYWNHVRWDFTFSCIGATIGGVDDGIPEGHGEVGIVSTGPNNYAAGWAYIYNTDGGVFNLAPGGPYWEIHVNPDLFGAVDNWQMYSGDGSFINLWNRQYPIPFMDLGLHQDDFYGPRETGAYTTIITPTIPEPATFLLFGCGLIGTGFIFRRRKK
jgi:hypothetical protein